MSDQDAGRVPLVPRFRSIDRRTRFFFVRHGESESNKRGVIQGHHDSPLSVTGMEHARAAARWFADQSIDCVLSSPLRRSSQTADVIAQTCGVTRCEAVAELIELDTGIFSGKRLADLSSEHPEVFGEFLTHSWEAVPGAEGVASLRRRANSAWHHLLDLADAGSRAIVSVTHGGMLQWLIKATLGCEVSSWMPLFVADNCGIFLFVIDPISAGVPGGGAGEGTRSTAADDLAVARADAALPPDRHVGYFGQWQLMNLLPY